MPVNYATPDPGIIDRPYVQQIPLEALFRNLAYKQSKYDQGYQQARQTLQAAGNIAAYGQDEKVRDEMFKKLNTDLQQFSEMDLGDSRVTGQLDTMIDGFTSSREVAGIDSRGRTFAKMQREEEAAQLKGLEYYNPGLDAARKYYAGGEYKPNTRFSDDGNIAPDMEKINKEILADPSVSYKRKEVRNGRIYETTIVDKDKAAAEYKRRALTDPRLSKYVQYKFNAATEGTEWKTAGIQHFEDKAKASQLEGLELQRKINLAQVKGSGYTAQDIASAQARLKAIQERTAQYQHVAQDPHMLGADFRNRMFDEYLSDESERYGLSKELNTVSDIDSDAMSVEVLRHQNDLAEASVKHSYDLETEAVKNAHERGYGFDRKTGKDTGPLEYNPDVPTKSGSGLNKVEYDKYVAVLSKSYGLLTENEVSTLDFVAAAFGGGGRALPIKKVGDDWVSDDGNEFPMLTRNNYILKTIQSSSKDKLKLIDEHLKSRLGTGAITKF